MTTDLKLTIFGEPEASAVEQIVRCMKAGDAVAGVLCADNHKGYSQPIGAAIGYENHVSPSGVGYDIGCGNKAVQTQVHVSHFDDKDMPKIVGEISRRISFGMGIPAQERTDHPVLDKIKTAEFAPQRQLHDLAAKQLGTVGAGNHYVDLFHDEAGWVWIGVHFGSRGFGHKTASGFLALAEGKRFGERATEGEMDSPPILFEIDSDLGQAYIAAMRLAGDYAHAGRDIVVDKVLEILETKADFEVHNHHNYAWRELHDGRWLWVVRKGCTPAYPEQRGFVGGSMGGLSVILRGAESELSKDALYSTVHGAGRLMSRTQAAGKVKRRKVYECTMRDCDFSIPAKEFQPGKSACPLHRNGRFRRIEQRELVRPGKVDWPAVQERLRKEGILLVGGAADEAPEVYKDLEQVLAAHGETIVVEQELHPLAVIMAGAEVQDAYKD